jgi:hypothetical protein
MHSKGDIVFLKPSFNFHCREVSYKFLEVQEVKFVDLAYAGYQFIKVSGNWYYGCAFTTILTSPIGFMKKKIGLRLLKYYNNNRNWIVLFGLFFGVPLLILIISFILLWII